MISLMPDVNDSEFLSPINLRTLVLLATTREMSNPNLEGDIYWCTAAVPNLHQYGEGYAKGVQKACKKRLIPRAKRELTAYDPAWWGGLSDWRQVRESIFSALRQFAD